MRESFSGSDVTQTSFKALSMTKASVHVPSKISQALQCIQALGLQWGLITKQPHLQSSMTVCGLHLVKSKVNLSLKPFFYTWQHMFLKLCRICLCIIFVLSQFNCAVFPISATYFMFAFVFPLKSKGDVLHFFIFPLRLLLPMLSTLKVYLMRV